MTNVSRSSDSPDGADTRSHRRLAWPPSSARWLAASAGFLFCVLFLAQLAAPIAFAQDVAKDVAKGEAGMGAKEAYADMERTLGMTPGFFKMFPEAGIAGAWAEFKGIQLNPATALTGKEKELIGLAVAAQVPCRYCVLFHTAAARLNGATDEEIGEAVAMAAITRHWSTVLNGMQVDEEQFAAEVSDLMRRAKAKAKPSQ